MFNFSALHYLHQWLTLDRPYVEAARANTLTLADLSEYLRRYEARRSIPGKGSAVLAPVWAQISAMNVQNNNVATAIDDCFLDLSQRLQRRFLSAITKAAWMKHGHPVAIYDSRARVALRQGGANFRDNDYVAYHREWMNYSESSPVQSALSSACRFVPTSCFARRLIANGAATQQKIDDWTSSDWFRNRVVDIRLFFLADHDRVPNANLARLLGSGEQP